MTVSILRTEHNWWVLTATGAAEIRTAASSTRELLQDRPAVDAAAARGGTVAVESLDLLSPLTAPCRVVAQMTNYASHARDAGLDPGRVPLTFFRKASGSVSGPEETILRPRHVTLLDYEVEIGLVIGHPLPVGTRITDGDLPRYVAGLVVANDVSARDVQLTRTQFYESKSYPTFTPVGPRLVLLEDDELSRFTELRLTLRVNGAVRQDRTAADMIYRPLQALRALTAFQHLDPGDLVLTGTPVGTALSAPPRPVRTLAVLLPEHVKWRLFTKGQQKNPEYLQDGDVVEASVATDDGAIDLGTQHTTVKWER
ncbi:fumarylacetoacetate hydrolase family protein [Streptacidiphilus sp. N1-12]|uniref:Fumarylacetoacetate hydrolase family protein n=2 Tax=Streptacidiphilus alkalitolerans TaxID=3342712 RepID=A0ABV6VLW2_9ACTN